MSAGVLVAALGAWRLLASAGVGAVARPQPSSPVDALENTLVRSNLDQPADPILQTKFFDIDTRHFGGALKDVPVRWEPRLSEAGALAGHAFTLEGLFGHMGPREVILLNPDLQIDSQAVDRALSHEMVHAWLFSTGDTTSGHGPAFQAVLRRLATEGAFAGTPATDAERTTLRAWIDGESARLDEEARTMTTLGADLDRDRAEIDERLADLNAKFQRGTPDATSDADVAQTAAMRDDYNRRAEEANARDTRDRDAVAHFNAEVARYNLMLVYPDGLDEHPFAQPKTTTAR